MMISMIHKDWTCVLLLVFVDDIECGVQMLLLSTDKTFVGIISLKCGHKKSTDRSRT